MRLAAEKAEAERPPLNKQKPSASLPLKPNTCDLLLKRQKRRIAAEQAEAERIAALLAEQAEQEQLAAELAKAQQLAAKKQAERTLLNKQKLNECCRSTG